MSWIDWAVLFGTLILIVSYGLYLSRNKQDLNAYFLGGNKLRWGTIGLSVMATQASAITFLSTPGQAYDDGMRFVQFYFGLPLAMIVICIFFIPIFYRLKVYTAYEYLENRFDRKTRVLTASLFLIQRGLATGITIYAPSIILSTILNWPLFVTNLIIGILVILYTVMGGSEAVSQTQKQQMVVIFTGLIVVFVVLMFKLPESVSFSESLQIAGSFGKMKIVDPEFDLSNRYTLWSGLLGGFFLALSYFGTDQSQVQRYLTGQSVTQSRMGLLMNGFLKVPMQVFILLIGVMVFVFYQFNSAPLFFNQAAVMEVKESENREAWEQLERKHEQISQTKSENLLIYSASGNEAYVAESLELDKRDKELREEARGLIRKTNPELETEDTDYVFITFVMNHLPVGIIGLLLAVIFSGAMSSTASELNALASTTVVDFYRVFTTPGQVSEVLISRFITLGWGIMAILFATFASLFDNLIEAINILGSLFYGTILGIFLVAFLLKNIRGTAVFLAALCSEAIVFSLFFLTEISYLFYNLVGCFAVILISLLFNLFNTKKVE